MKSLMSQYIFRKVYFIDRFIEVYDKSLQVKGPQSCGFSSFEDDPISWISNSGRMSVVHSGASGRNLFRFSPFI